MPELSFFFLNQAVGFPAVCDIMGMEGLTKEKKMKPFTSRYARLVFRAVCSFLPKLQGLEGF